MPLTHVDHAQNLDAREPVFLHGRFFGVSTDTKPTTLDDDSTAVPSGMLFEEVDTRRVFRFNGEAWLELPIVDTVSDHILVELKQLNAQLAELLLFAKLTS